MRQVIGIAAPIVGGWLVLDGVRYQPLTEVLEAASLLVAACLQLPMGLAVRRQLRRPV